MGHGAQEEDDGGWDWGVAEDVSAGLAAGDAEPFGGVVLLHAEAADEGLELGAGHGALGLPGHARAPTDKMSGRLAVFIKPVVHLLASICVPPWVRPPIRKPRPDPACLQNRQTRSRSDGRSQRDSVGLPSVDHLDNGIWVPPIAQEYAGSVKEGRAGGAARVVALTFETPISVPTGVRENGNGQ
jgi:hypothetical protein